LAYLLLRKERQRPLENRGGRAEFPILIEREKQVRQRASEFRTIGPKFLFLLSERPPE